MFLQHSSFLLAARLRSVMEAVGGIKHSFCLFNYIDGSKPLTLSYPDLNDASLLASGLASRTDPSLNNCAHCRSCIHSLLSLCPVANFVLLIYVETASPRSSFVLTSQSLWHFVIFPSRAFTNKKTAKHVTSWLFLPPSRLVSLAFIKVSCHHDMANGNISWGDLHIHQTGLTRIQENGKERKAFVETNLHPQK